MPKISVVSDELGVKGGGLYAMTPFDVMDDYGKMVFKIGIAVNFKKRIDLSGNF